MTRTFEARPARREHTPMILGIVASSGAGKTKSALRLADGIRRVTPGKIILVDTEAGRAKHHADAHDFLHIDMSPPFGPADHIAAWEEALRHGPVTIIQDSMSHEHEGSGGVLEMHEAELERMAGSDWKKRERCTMAAWIRPKAEHNRMRHFMLQQRVNWILCFRAKPKIKIVKGGEPIDLGWQALGAPDLIYEMLLKALLFPGSDGRPTWRSDKLGEQELMKLPGWFRDIFTTSPQLSEDIGEQLARWAAGGDVVVTPGIAERFDACATPEDFKLVDADARAAWPKLSPADRDMVNAALKRATARLKPQGATQ